MKQAMTFNQVNVTQNGHTDLKFQIVIQYLLLFYKMPSDTSIKYPYISARIARNNGFFFRLYLFYARWRVDGVSSTIFKLNLKFHNFVSF